MGATKGNGRNAGHAAPAKTHTNNAIDVTAAADHLVLITTATEPRVDSRLLAQHLGIQHESAFKSLKDFQSDFEMLGKVRFQIGASPGSSTGQKVRFAMLNEDQSLLMLTYSRNTARVRSLKVRLVKAFGDARRAADMRQTEYMPTYHAAHDRIKALAAGSSRARFQHMNFNKLLNKVAGVEAGQRASAPVPKQALLIVGQMLATVAMQSARDGKEACRLACNAVQPLTNAALALGGAA